MKVSQEQLDAYQRDLDEGWESMAEDKAYLCESLYRKYLMGEGVHEMKKFIKEFSEEFLPTFYKDYYNEISDIFIAKAYNFERDLKIHLLKIDLGEIDTASEKTFLYQCVEDAFKEDLEYREMVLLFDRYSKSFFARCYREYFDEISNTFLKNMKAGISRHTNDIRGDIHEMFREMRNPNRMEDIRILKYRKNKEILISKK